MPINMHAHAWIESPIVFAALKELAQRRPLLLFVQGMHHTVNGVNVIGPLRHGL